MMISNYSTFKTLLFSALLALGAMQAHAQTMGEVFGCNFNDGQDMDDLMGARDLYLKASEKAGVPAAPAFVWSPVKVTPGGIDYLWFNYHPSVAAYGAAFDARMGSEFQEVIERFNRVSTCRSALFSEEQVYAGNEQLSGGGPFYITSAACNFRPGADASSLPDLNAHANDYLSQAGTHDDFILLQRTPVTGSADGPDIRIAAVHNSASDWAARQESLAASEGGRMLMRHFQNVFECSSSHWSSQNMVPFPEQ
jgi:hypothetical protein